MTRKSRLEPQNARIETNSDVYRAGVGMTEPSRRSYANTGEMRRNWDGADMGVYDIQYDVLDAVVKFAREQDLPFYARLSDWPQGRPRVLLLLDEDVRTAPKFAFSRRPDGSFLRCAIWPGDTCWRLLEVFATMDEMLCATSDILDYPDLTAADVECYVDPSLLA